MSTISTFGTFTMARLGIYAATKGLNVTGNNITNINTPGYTRQAIDQQSMYISGADHYSAKYDQRIGNGALVKRVTQLRDPYLDIRYRNENASVGAADAKLAGLDDIASVLDEVGKGDGDGELEAVLNDMLTQLENLVTQGANQDDYDTLMRSGSDSVCGVFHMFATKLETLRKNEDVFFHQEVTTVNGILQSIQELNAQIRKANIHGSDALEEKDTRNNLIDQLSNYMKIRVKYVDEDLGGFTVEKLVIQLDGGDNVEPDESLAGLQGDDLKAAEERNKERAARRAANDVTLIDGVYARQFSIRQEQAQAVDESGNKLYWDPFSVGNVTTTKGRGLNGELNPAVMLYRDQDGEEHKVIVDDRNPNAVLYRDAETGEPYVYSPNDGTLSSVAGADVRTLTPVMQDSENLDMDVTPLVDLNGKRKLASITTTPDYKKDKYSYTGTLEDAKAQFATDRGLAANASDFLAVSEDGNTEFVYQLVRTGDDPANPGDPTKGTYTVQVTAYGLSKTENLYDNTLYGALQSERELLTEYGEFCTAEQLANDPGANMKRGYPYYQLALDSLAKKYAEILNDANEKQPVKVSETEETVPVYEILEPSRDDVPVTAVQCFDKNGKPILKSDGSPLFLKAAMGTWKEDPKDVDEGWYLLADETCEIDADGRKIADGPLTADDVNQNPTDPTSTGNVLAIETGTIGGKTITYPTKVRLTDEQVAKLLSEGADNPHGLEVPMEVERMNTTITINGEDQNLDVQIEKRLNTDGTVKGWYYKTIPGCDLVGEQLRVNFKNAASPTDPNAQVTLTQDQLDHFFWRKHALEGEKTPESPKYPTTETVKEYKKTQVGEVVVKTPTTEVKGGVLISNSGNSDDTTNITAKNISVSKSWGSGAVRIEASFQDLAPSTANDNLAHILTQFISEENHAFYPRDVRDVATSEAPYFEGTYQGKLVDMWNTLARDTNVTSQALENYTTALDELYVNRDGVSGVDLNDETMNMMQYQKAYAASCRLLTTIDEMLDKLINGTGRAGL